jgi:O-antigen ligase
MQRQIHKNISEGYSFAPATVSQQVAIKGGFLVLIAFAILRPMSLMGREDLAIGALGITELMGVGISYLLILLLLAGMKQIKFDLLSLFILAFIFYAIESLIWGSELRRTSQAILPFILFFSIRTFITETKQVRALLIFLVLGFIIPIAFSTYNIILGKSIQMIEWHNQLPRFAGAFTGIHTLSYSMLFFSFLYCILHHIYQFRNSLNRFLVGFILILSAYCLYKSLTRTAMVGFILFWLIYLWGINKRAFFIAIVISVIVGVVFSNHIYSIVFKKENIDLNTATSGRVTLFVSNIKLFLDSSFLQQLFGRGLGGEHRFRFHNDYISLLMELGITGLFLYLILLFYLLKDIFLCKDKKTKYLFGAILISVAIINFGSNAVIFRIEFSQYFWTIMGIFYVLEQNKRIEYKEKQNLAENF